MNETLFDSLKLIRQDWDRYTKSKNPFFLFAKGIVNPGIFFSLIFRIEYFLINSKNFFLKSLGWIFFPIYYFISYYIFSYTIFPFTQIGGGLYIHNREVVIYDFAKIGKNFTVMGQTTIGVDFDSPNLEIVIGDNVSIGVGAKIIARKNDLKIADGVKIGANAVVLKSIKEENSTWVGIPAKKIS